MAFGILILDKDPSHPFPNESYRKGDPVCIYPASQCREPPSPKNPHLILVVEDGPTPEEARAIIQPRLFTDAAKPMDDSGMPLNRLVERSQFAFNEKALPKAISDKLKKDGLASCTYAEFQLAMFDKELGIDLKTIGGIEKVHYG